MRLHGKTAIVTGASSGIGEAAARLFAAEGANVILCARRQRRLSEVTDAIAGSGGTAVAVCGDLRDEGVAVTLVDTALSRFGRLDVAFNNAGILGAGGDFTEMAAEDWHATIETNLTSAFFAAKHQIGALRRAGSGSVIFVSSFVGATIGFPGMAAYGASKAGLIGMTQCLAAEFGHEGIRVNALLPGGTKTAMAGDFSNDAAAAETIAGFHALKRMASPEEIAKAALFLASDDASFVTGSAMFADGGNSIMKI